MALPRNCQRGFPAGFFSPENYFDVYGDRTTPETTEKQVAWLVGEILPQSRRAGGVVDILDLACGQGRHAIELAKRGYKLTGLDFEPGLLQLAQDASRDAGVNVEWLQRDMRDIREDAGFDVVLNMFTSFGYSPTDSGDRDVIVAVSRALRPGGLFVLDVQNRERHLRNVHQSPVVKSTYADATGNGDIHITKERHFDLETGCKWERQERAHPDGRKVVLCHAIRLYTLSELIGLCDVCGLTFVRAYGDYDNSAFALESERCILLARRR